MRSLRLLVGFTVLFRAGGLAQDTRGGGNVQKDIEKLQGVWNIVSLEMDGSSTSGAALNGASIAIRGERFTSTGMGAVYEGTIEVDASANPRAFTLKFTSGPETGNSNLGIYELDNDTWRICLATRGATRPGKFEAVPGSGIALEVLKRGGAAPEPNVERSASSSGPQIVNAQAAPELEGEWSMVSGTFDGQPLDKNYVRLGKRVVTGTNMEVTFGGEVYSRATYTVDRSKTPTAIEIHNSEGANAGKMQYGIYEVDGDTLRLSVAGPGRDRPTDFSSAPGDGRTVVVWTRSGAGKPK